MQAINGIQIDFKNDTPEQITQKLNESFKELKDKQKSLPVKDYRIITTIRNDSSNEAIDQFGRNFKQAVNEGFEPIGSPSVALSQTGCVIMLTMVRERKEQS